MRLGLTGDLERLSRLTYWKMGPTGEWYLEPINMPFNANVWMDISGPVSNRRNERSGRREMARSTLSDEKDVWLRRFEVLQGRMV